MTHDYGEVLDLIDDLKKMSKKVYLKMADLGLISDGYILDMRVGRMNYDTFARRADIELSNFHYSEGNGFEDRYEVYYEISNDGKLTGRWECANDPAKNPKSFINRRDDYDEVADRT